MSLTGFLRTRVPSSKPTPELKHPEVGEIWTNGKDPVRILRRDKWTHVTAEHVYGDYKAFTRAYNGFLKSYVFHSTSLQDPNLTPSPDDHLEFPE